MRVAGSVHPVFSNGALAELHHRSQGIPRLINIMADRALLGAFTLDRHTVNAALQRRAASEVLGRRLMPRWLPWAGVALAAMIVALVFWFVRTSTATSARPTSPPAVAPE
jgi:general secretion pathway protein A